MHQAHHAWVGHRSDENQRMVQLLPAPRGHTHFRGGGMQAQQAHTNPTQSPGGLGPSGVGDLI